MDKIFVDSKEYWDMYDEWKASEWHWPDYDDTQEFEDSVDWEQSDILLIN